MPRFLLVLALLAASAVGAEAKVITQVVEYQQGDAALEGFLAYDDAVAGPRPGVLILHDWTGVGKYVQGRAEQLAALGYVALAADIYGKGVRPTAPEDCSREAGKFKNDRALLRLRAAAGLQRLAAHERTDKARLAVIGYCFGGMAALEVARSGADVKAVVSFHGSLDAARRDEGKQIKGKVLICHGADDRFVPASDIADTQEELRSAGVDWQFVAYGGAVHSFTNPEAGSDPSRGVAYNAAADRRSWASMLALFDEVFGPRPR